MNIVSLARLAWQFMKKKEQLWIRVTEAEYGDIRARDWGKVA